jgi:hypothetical protein
MINPLPLHTFSACWLNSYHIKRERGEKSGRERIACYKFSGKFCESMRIFSPSGQNGIRIYWRDSSDYRISVHILYIAVSNVSGFYSQTFTTFKE